MDRREVAAIDRPPELTRLEDLGLSLDEGKAILAELQATVIEQQFERDRDVRAPCGCCGRRRRINDHRAREGTINLGGSG